MRFVPTDIAGVVIIEPDVHRDARGFFLETYHERKFREGGIDARFVQDNHSLSRRGTLRGLHAQRTRPQGKLVRVIHGEVFDVAVDIRRGSPTFLKWTSVVLSAENFLGVYIPPGFAHGFCVTSESAEVVYKCTELYDPQDEFGLVWNDPSIGIRWPIDTPVVSAKDQAACRVSDILDILPEREI